MAAKARKKCFPIVINRCESNSLVSRPADESPEERMMNNSASFIFIDKEMVIRPRDRQNSIDLELHHTAVDYDDPLKHKDAP